MNLWAPTGDGEKCSQPDC